MSIWSPFMNDDEDTPLSVSPTTISPVAQEDLVNSIRRYNISDKPHSPAITPENLRTWSEQQHYSQYPQQYPMSSYSTQPRSSSSTLSTRRASDVSVLSVASSRFSVATTLTTLSTVSENSSTSRRSKQSPALVAMPLRFPENISPDVTPPSSPDNTAPSSPTGGYFDLNPSAVKHIIESRTTIRKNESPLGKSPRSPSLSSHGSTMNSPIILPESSLPIGCPQPPMQQLEDVRSVLTPGEVLRQSGQQSNVYSQASPVSRFPPQSPPPSYKSSVTSRN